MDNIKNIIIDYANKEYLKYKYLGFSKEEFISLIYNNINKNNNSNNFNIGEHVKNIIRKYFRDSLKKDKIIDRFISDNLHLYDDYNKCINELSKLSMLFTFLDYEPSLDFIIKIININSILSSILLNIITEKIELIQNYNTEKISSDKLITSFINAYCIVNDIDIIEDNLLDKISLSLTNADALDFYILDVRKNPKLSSSENEKLFRRLANGESEVKQKIIEGNLPLVIYFAVKYIHTTNKMQLEDHIQNGNLGLLKAVEKYDIKTGYKFSTYAAYWIKAYIERGIDYYSRTIKIPEDIVYKLKRIRKCEEILLYRLNRIPTIVEVANELGMKPETVSFINNYRDDVLSLNIPISEDGDEELSYYERTDTSSTQDVEKIVINSSLSSDVHELLKSCGLTKKEIGILMLIYNKNSYVKLTRESIGKKFNLSRERIRQIEVTALRKIRQSDIIKEYSSYMDNPSKSEEFIDFCRSQYIINPKTTKRFSQSDITDSYKSNPKYISMLKKKESIDSKKHKKINPIFIEINKLIKSDKIDVKKITKNQDEISIIYLAFGCIDGKYYPPHNISLLLNIPEDKVLNIIKKILLISKKFFGLHDKGKILRLIDSIK